jgi:chromosome condensin MukBEF ATPase and DNA-binding subunit MukB
MAETQNVLEVDPNDTQVDLQSLSLESLILLLNTEKLAQLKTSTKKELDELKKRQGQVKRLHDILSSINKATEANGILDVAKNPTLQPLLKELKELGVEAPQGKGVFAKEERDRLVENIRMATEDLNVENDLQIQNLSRLTNERYETYQMARGILEPLARAKQNAAKGIGGH